MNLTYLAAADPMGGYGTLILLAVMFGALYFFMIRPQRRKEKQATELRNSIEIGDEVTTIGGIVGRVVNIKEDTFVLETAGERSRMRFKRWAIQEVGKLSMESSGEVEANPADKGESSGGFLGGLFGKKKDNASKG